MKLKLNNVINTTLLATALTLTACGGSGGGGGGGTGGGGTGGGGGTYVPTHAELASDFVQKMNNELGYDVSLVKTNTEQYGYIVVQDYDAVDYDIYGNLLPVYDAYYINDYDLNSDIDQYLVDYDADIFYYLDDLFNGTFEGYDPVFDEYLIFEETQISSKDLEKVGGMLAEIKVSKAAEKLAAEFGLSEERSMSVAKMASQWEKVSKKRAMTTADADAFSKGMLGVSLTAVKDAYTESLQGNDSMMAELLEEAALVNGTSPEHMNDLMNEFIAK